MDSLQAIVSLYIAVASMFIVTTMNVIAINNLQHEVASFGVKK